MSKPYMNKEKAALVERGKSSLEVNTLLAGAIVNKDIENYLLLNLPGSATLSAELTSPGSLVNLKPKDIELLQRIKADNLSDFANKIEGKPRQKG